MRNRLTRGRRYWHLSVPMVVGGLVVVRKFVFVERFVIVGRFMVVRFVVVGRFMVVGRFVVWRFVWPRVGFVVLAGGAMVGRRRVGSVRLGNPRSLHGLLLPPLSFLSLLSFFSFSLLSV